MRGGWWWERRSRKGGGWRMQAGGGREWCTTKEMRGSTVRLPPEEMHSGWALRVRRATKEMRRKIEWRKSYLL
ncbi:hypothetical protein E2562_032604 [Oryza meyeriana var. granulata]|uniref:Uncharacterized protein n=1 Tax=Oryza meyeriana var. granulata TaxID=110450 RepID=A0A6G1E5I1_9ORYZ|nr:hypothetical protein E2562_032604 [Oryza meyeriana var. granulata]